MVTTIIKGKIHNIKSFLDDVYGDGKVKIDYYDNDFPLYIFIDYKNDNTEIGEDTWIENQDVLDISISNDKDEYIIQISVDSLIQDNGAKEMYYKTLQGISKKYSLEIKAFSFSEYYLAVSYFHYKNGEKLEDIFKHYYYLFGDKREEE